MNITVNLKSGRVDNLGSVDVGRGFDGDSDVDHERSNFEEDKAAFFDTMGEGNIQQEVSASAVVGLAQYVADNCSAITK